MRVSNERGLNWRITLLDLSVELIEEIYVLAGSPAFPQTCQQIHSAVKSFSPFAHAYYILGRCPREWWGQYEVSMTLGSALRYPITTLAVLDALYTIIARSNSIVDRQCLIWLPKRLFRSLGGPDKTRDANSYPLPILRFLWGEGRANTDFPLPDLWRLGGYPLVCAVHAEFIPLVQFLLDHGAPHGSRKLAIEVAICKKNLELVKMLIESEVNTEMVIVQDFWVNLAIDYDARDIVKYLMEEHGCIALSRTSRRRDRKTGRYISPYKTAVMQDIEEVQLAISNLPRPYHQSRP